MDLAQTPARTPVRVELRGVSKTYGPVRALVGVSASFEAGRVTVVGGANGSGKSTLLSIAADLARPTSGTVDYGGLGSDRHAIRSAIGWLGHDSLCYGDLTGRENVELAARLRGIDPAEAYVASARRFDLEAFAHRPVRTYSRGQRQRIALARALLHAPSVLFLDEPTAGLDRPSVERLVAIVKEEAGRGAVVVLVTHDHDVAGLLGDVRLTLERGRLVE
jgi:ABC-type multidrug transport system ATPase subunit